MPAANGDLTVLGPELPDSLSGVRVLDAGAADEALAARLAEAGAEVVRFDPTGAEGEGFGLILCRGQLQAEPHPMNLLSRLWHAGAEGATLLISSAVLTDPGESRFARFPLPGDTAAEPGWLPGRLALRWSVEVSGFEFERWLGPGPEADAGPHGVAHLRAVRVGRTPALDQSTPRPGV